MSHVIAYDFGTGGIKASIYDVSGSCLASHFATYETYYPATGFHEQSPEMWWLATVEATKALLTEWSGNKNSIKAIGISGHSLAVVPVGKDGQLLREYGIIWSDSRPTTQVDEFFAKTDAENWYMKTGNGFPPQLYSVFKIMWLRDNEKDVFSKIYKVLGSKDYINYRMTNVMATDYSYASGSGVWDLKKWCYDEELINAASLDKNIFPEAFSSHHVIGNLTVEAAEQLSLTTEVKVVAGGVDNSCMALGARAFRDGDVYNSMGSSSWIAVTDKKPLLNLDSKPYVFAHVVPEKFTSAIGVFATGSALRWVKELLFNYYNEECIDNQNPFAAMVNSAEKVVPGANGVYFLPTLAGGSSLDHCPEVRGSFANLDLKNGFADICRATLEGIAMAQANALKTLEELTTLKNEILAVGGGARDDFFMEIFATLYQKDIVRTQVGQQAAALGAAAVALVGIGEWETYDKIAEIHNEVARQCKNENLREFYHEHLERFNKLNKKLSDWAVEVN
ncbi:FGGY family carbohydrate kinase [Lentisphaerota bacterium WC36G]|nr:pentose kinase [Lentisphaerae bacterium WC36]